MNHDIFSGTRFKLIFTFILFILSVLFYLLLRKVGINYQHAILDVVITQAFLYFTCLIIANILRYYIPKESKQIIIVAWSLVFTLLWLIATYFTLRWVIDYTYFDTQLDYTHLMLRLIYGFQFITAFAFYLSLWLSQERRLELDKRKSEVEQIEKTAELFKLRQQFQPHFLFNSLNSINALIRLDSNQARIMVQNLSDFMRFTLNKEDRTQIPLQEEIKYINLYLDIEKIRFGNRLQTEIEIGENASGTMIPAMILQPVLENAIKHGLYDTLENVLIRVEAKMVNGNLEVLIVNPYDEQSVSSTIGTGFGLKSIHRRLFLLFSRNDLLEIHKQDNIFTTKLIIPQ